VILTVNNVAEAPGNVDALVNMTFTGYVLNRLTNTYDIRATITNTSTQPIYGPMTLVITSIAPNSVTLANATGQTPDG